MEFFLAKYISSFHYHPHNQIQNHLKLHPYHTRHERECSGGKIAKLEDSAHISKLWATKLHGLQTYLKIHFCHTTWCFLPSQLGLCFASSLLLAGFHCLDKKECISLKDNTMFTKVICYHYS